MMPKHTGEPDFALIGLALLIILAFMMWQDRPIQSPRPYDSAGKHQQNPRITGNVYESWLWQDPFGFEPTPKSGETQPQDQCHILLESKNDITKVFVLKAKIHPNTIETKELRTRSRYAVVSGLIESGYFASEPTQINFCAIKDGTQYYDARWELFTNTKNENNNVLVIWLDVDQLHKDFPPENKLCDLVPVDPICKPSINIIPISIHEPTKIQLDLLAAELKKRKITESSEIVLITEHDTKSIQTIATDFCKAFKVNDCDAANISNYKYFKGLDAYQRQLGKQGQEGAGKTAEKREELLSIIDQHNLPIGPAQFDYLYRLVKQIKESHKNSEHSKHIKAAGVFGSDFYDKLIIFEALRAEIPNIVVFTTDLDAEMLHPQYWRWTRNLIVATPFDLRLKEELQKQIPPFRDSLQTQIFHEILKNVKSNIPNTAPPLIFEIGRNGPVYLAGYDKDSVHPDYTKPQSRLINQLILWFFIAIALIFTVQQIKPHSGAIVFWLMATAIALFALAGYAINWGSEEPFSFTDGVSMWPSILLRWFTFFVVIAFIFSAIRALETNFDRLNRRYYPDPVNNPDSQKNLNTLWKDEKPLSESELLKENFNRIIKQPNESSKLGKERALSLTISVLVLVLVLVQFLHMLITLEFQ